MINRLRNRDRSTGFSDNIVISSSAEWGGFGSLMNSICEYSLKLLERGYLVRGGLTVGKLLHDDSTLMGPALIEAHVIESQQARFPRVLLSSSALEAIETCDDRRQRGEPSLRSFFFRNRDGSCHLNYLCYDAIRGDYSKWESTMEAVRPLIERQIVEQDATTPGLGKWKWLAQYFNDCVLSGPYSPLELIPIPNNDKTD